MQPFNFEVRIFVRNNRLRIVFGDYTNTIEYSEAGKLSVRLCRIARFPKTSGIRYWERGAWNGIYQRKKGSQHARNADMMIPSVLAAFRSLLILLLLVIGGSSDCGSGDDWSTVGSDVRPAEMPLICRCLFKSAAATLLLQQTVPYLVFLFTLAGYFQ